MKVLLYGLVASLLLSLLPGCRSPRIVGETRVITLKNDTVIKERLVPILSPADSARIKALMRCDKNGRVLLEWYEQECSRNAKLRFMLDSLGNLMVDFDRIQDTIYVPVKDTSINSSSESDTVNTVEVERKMRGWEKYMIVVGFFAHGLLLGYGVFKLRKFFI